MTTPYTNLTVLQAKSSGGKLKNWSIWLEPDEETVTVEWFLEGGAAQRSSDKAKPKGKVGTKAYKDAKVCALENMAKQIRKKREEGYLAPGETAAEVDYLMGLDKNFVPAKPVQKEEQEKLVALDKAGKLMIQRKRDGRRHLVLIDREGNVRIYSRRMEDLTEHLAKLRTHIALMNLAAGTILDGEVVVVNPDGSDNFRAVGEFTNPATEPEKAARRAADYDVRFMVFDVLWWGGAQCWDRPYERRYDLLGRTARIPVDSRKMVHLAEVLNAPAANGDIATLTQLQELAKREKWEGLILWKADEASFVRVGGKPKRINSIKWKPKLDIDVIATGYFMGSGEWSNVIGGFNLAEYDPKTGQLRDAGKCGTGFDAAMRAEAMTWTYPCVIAIRCDYQEPESGKFRFPVFLKKHEDKTPDECVGIELEEGDE